VQGPPDELVRRYWPDDVVIDAEDPGLACGGLPTARRARRPPTAASGPATVVVDDLARIPDLVLALAAAGVRVTRVEPHEPTLEDLYFAVRRAGRTAGEVHPRPPPRSVAAPPRRSRPRAGGTRGPQRTGPLHWDQITVARTDLKQLIQAKDFWIPMVHPRRHLLRASSPRSCC
jgi:hypothetical protein